MANVAQTVNCIHSLFLALEDNYTRTPPYYVFEIYRPHLGARSVPLQIRAGERNCIINAQPSCVPRFSAAIASWRIQPYNRRRLSSQRFSICAQMDCNSASSVRGNDEVVKGAARWAAVLMKWRRFRGCGFLPGSSISAIIYYLLAQAVPKLSY